MKITPLHMCTTALALLAGCAHMKVSTEGDKTCDFTKIKTYQWCDAPSEILDQEDTYISFNMQKALNNELAARGWKQVLDASNASVQVTSYFKLKAHQEYTEAATDREREFAGGLVYKNHNGKWNYEERGPDQVVYLVETATLHFAITDAATGECIWRGRVETGIDRSLPDEKLDELFRNIARKMTERLPGEAGQ